MNVLYSWSVFAWIFIKYLPWRLGLLRRRTDFTDHPAAVITAVTGLFRWKRRVRVVNGELCPRTPPALFVANHHKLDDPVDLWPGIHWGAQGGIIPSFVMRDDFFRGFPWTWLPWDMNHLCAMTGAVLISRDQLKLAQLRQMLEKLAGGGALVLFPGRTRSRTGAWFEYRDGIPEPGSPAFVIANAQRRHRGLRVPAVPVTRTWHPVRNTTAVVFGAPVYLGENADRDAQRALDHELLFRVGGLVEVHAVHLAAVLLWMHTLHRGAAPLPAAQVGRAMAQWAASEHHPFVDPVLRNDCAGECRAALDFFARRGMLERKGELLLPHCGRILACPEWTERYRDENPVKYWANQMLHVRAVVEWAENAVMNRPE